MNIDRVKTYMKKMNTERFDNYLNMNKIKFVPSPDDGIIVDIDDGVHSLRVGHKINEHQMNRALIVMLIDSCMGVTEESQRQQFSEKSYNEYGGKVSILQEKYFPNNHVFVEKNGKIIEDDVVDCTSNTCTLKKAGRVEKKNIMGLHYSEVKFKK